MDNDSREDSNIEGLNEGKTLEESDPSLIDFINMKSGQGKKRGKEDQGPGGGETLNNKNRKKIEYGGSITNGSRPRKKRSLS
jgi:hypothetical protein